MYEPFIELSGKVGSFGHGFTYSGHPVGAAAALAALTEKDRRDLEFVLDLGIDWLALSFVQRPEDVAGPSIVKRYGVTTALLVKLLDAREHLSVQVHPDADYGRMVACLDELRLANATKVSLKTADR